MQMLRVIVSSSIVIALTWLHWPAGAGLAWDALNGFGFFALGVLGALHLENLRPAPTTHPPIRERLLRHSRLGHLALFLVVIHAAGLTILDPLLLEYLKPTAPLYMIVGLIALVLLMTMIWSAALPRRRRLHGTQERFRLVHRVLGVSLLILSGWHVVGAGFYLDHPAQKLALVGLIAVWILFPQRTAQLLDRIAARPSEVQAGAALLTLLVVHTLARNV